MGMVFGMLVAMVLAAAVGSLISAIVLRLAVRWVEKREIDYGTAYVTMLIGSLIQVGLGFVVGLVVGGATKSQDAVNVASLVMYPVGFLIQSGIISSRIDLRFGRACLVSLAMMAIGIAIALAVAIPVLLIVALMS